MLKWISHLSFSLLTYIRLISEYIRVLILFLSHILVFLYILFPIIKNVSYMNKMWVVFKRESSIWL